jgi:TRAP-type C4-dicarboxylate transport system permease small subunit
MIERLLRILRGPAIVMTALASLITILMMLNVTADVIGRTFFNKPVHATLEIVESIYMVCISFLPMALVQHDREHLLIELFVPDADSPVGRVATLMSSLIALFLCALIAWKTIGIAIKKTEILEVVYLVDSFLPVWWVRWVIAIAFVLVSMILALQVVQDFSRFGKPHRPKHAHGAEPAHVGME